MLNALARWMDDNYRGKVMQEHVRRIAGELPVLRAKVAELDNNVEELLAYQAKVMKQRNEAQARVAELEADKTRMDFIERTKGSLHQIGYTNAADKWGYWFGRMEAAYGAQKRDGYQDTAREALDAAREAEPAQRLADGLPKLPKETT